jgi:hypothetical protein
MQPPSSNIDRVYNDLKTVLDYYDSFEDAVKAGKKNFETWCKTPRKDKRGNYSPLNPGWIEKWLEALARKKINEKPPQSINQISQLAKAKSV